jgi:hypothetical protein
MCIFTHLTLDNGGCVRCTRTHNHHYSHSYYDYHYTRDTGEFYVGRGGSVLLVSARALIITIIILFSLLITTGEFYMGGGGDVPDVQSCVRTAAAKTGLISHLPQGLKS